jgi:hypothetical protein
MKKLLALSAAIIFSLNVFSQAPAIQWQKSLGGTTNEAANSIRQTSDGGYIVAGYAYSNDGDVTGNHGADDYWVVKLGVSGNLQWQKCLGGTVNDAANSIQQTTDGGYIIAGNSVSNNGDVTGNHGANDYWVVKLDISGNIQWQKCLGGNADDRAYSVKQTNDGGYIVVGSSSSINGDVTGHHGSALYSDYWLVKLDVNGNIQWEKSLGGAVNDNAYYVQQTVDNGFVIAGYSYSADGDVTAHIGSITYSDIWIVKTDSIGNIQWEKSIGGTINDYSFSIQQTIDGGYIVAGYSNSVCFSYDDYWIFKLDGSGNTQWQRCIGGTSNDRLFSIEQTTDGGFILAGSSDSNSGNVSGNHGSQDYWVVKLDTAGYMQWQKCLGGTGSEYSYSIQQTSDAGYIVAGESQSNNGDVTGNQGLKDYWVVKLYPDFPTSINENISFFSFSLSPNPASSNLFLTLSSNIKPNTSLSIYNFLGAEVLAVPVRNSQTNINISALPAGVYFVNVKEAGKSLRGKKFVKI